MAHVWDVAVVFLRYLLWLKVQIWLWTWKALSLCGSLSVSQPDTHTHVQYFTVLSWRLTCFTSCSHKSRRTDTVSVNIMTNPTIETLRTVLVTGRTPLLTRTIYRENRFSLLQMYISKVWRAKTQTVQVLTRLHYVRLSALNPASLSECCCCICWRMQTCAVMN